MIKSKAAQSILEYTLLLAALIAVVIAVLFAGGDSSLQNKFKNTYSKAADTMKNNADKIKEDAFAPQNAMVSTPTDPGLTS